MQTIDESTDTHKGCENRCDVQKYSVTGALPGEMEDAVAASARSALEDGAHPEKQDEARNQKTRGTWEIGATQMLHRMQRPFIGYVVAVMHHS